MKEEMSGKLIHLRDYLILDSHPIALSSHFSSAATLRHQLINVRRLASFSVSLMTPIGTEMFTISLMLSAARMYIGKQESQKETKLVF